MEADSNVYQGETKQHSSQVKKDQRRIHVPDNLDRIAIERNKKQDQKRTQQAHS